MNNPNHGSGQLPGEQISATPPPKGSIVVLDEFFTERYLNLHDKKVTGNQISEAAGFRSSDEIIILQQLPNGGIESIRAEEVVDLGAPGAERFFVMPADSTYRFIVDGLKLEWPRSSLSGKAIRLLALKGESFEVVQEHEDVPDRTVAEDEVVTLAGAGTERFKTRPISKNVTVYYGEAPYVLPAGNYTTEQLISLFAVEPGYLFDLIEQGKLVELKPGESIKLKNGMRFTSHPPRGQSS
ncbi:multiubiquitin domain-containing protein [Variovorax atrisoli]|uniref:multiubiquitin domain-containing protein n=1 Tax=Variovorax atrisoli TaxID=3394203 RepID=UPI0040400465